MNIIIEVQTNDQNKITDIVIEDAGHIVDQHGLSVDEAGEYIKVLLNKAIEQYI